MSNETKKSPGLLESAFEGPSGIVVDLSGQLLSPAQKDDAFERGLHRVIDEASRGSDAVAKLSQIARELFEENQSLTAKNVSLLASLERLANENRELRKQATDDPMTGLKTGKVMQEKLEKELQRLRASHRRESDSGHPVVIFYFDMNNLKTFNDDLGEYWGDQLIFAFADCLKNTLRGEDLVVRSHMTGDEFMILAHGGWQAQSVISYKIRQALSEARITVDLREELQELRKNEESCERLTKLEKLAAEFSDTLGIDISQETFDVQISAAMSSMLIDRDNVVMYNDYNRIVKELEAQAKATKDPDMRGAPLVRLLSVGNPQSGNAPGLDPV